MCAAGARNLASVAGPAGTLLVLEDVPWAGADTLDLLATLVRAPEETPVRVLGAYRSTEVQPRNPAGRVAHRSRAGAPDRAGAAASLAPQEAAALLSEVHPTYLERKL